MQLGWAYVEQELVWFSNLWGHRIPNLEKAFFPQPTGNWKDLYCTRDHNVAWSVNKKWLNPSLVTVHVRDEQKHPLRLLRHALIKFGRSSIGAWRVVRSEPCTWIRNRPKSVEMSLELIRIRQINGFLKRFSSLLFFPLSPLPPSLRPLSPAPLLSLSPSYLFGSLSLWEALFFCWWKSDSSLPPSLLSLPTSSSLFLYWKHSFFADDNPSLPSPLSPPVSSFPLSGKHHFFLWKSNRLRRMLTESNRSRVGRSSVGFRRAGWSESRLFLMIRNGQNPLISAGSRLFTPYSLAV